jgi:hypothetical protein
LFDVDVWAFKLSCDVDFGWATVLATFSKKLGEFFSLFLVTLKKLNLWVELIRSSFVFLD